MDVQVLKSFTAYDRKLHPGEIIDAGKWNIGRVQKLINQRYIVPIKIAEGKIEVSPTLDPILKPPHYDTEELAKIAEDQETYGDRRARLAREKSEKSSKTVSKMWEDPGLKAKRSAEQTERMKAYHAAKRAAKAAEAVNNESTEKCDTDGSESS
jgi:hypothetical protein